MSESLDLLRRKSDLLPLDYFELPERVSVSKDSSEALQLCAVLELSDNLYVISAADVEHIAPLQQPFCVPHATSPIVSGFLPFRGAPVPHVLLHSLFGLPSPVGELRRTLFLRHEGFCTAISVSSIRGTAEIQRRYCIEGNQVATPFGPAAVITAGRITRGAS